MKTSQPVRFFVSILAVLVVLSPLSPVLAQDFALSSPKTEETEVKTIDFTPSKEVVKQDNISLIGETEVGLTKDILGLTSEALQSIEEEIVLSKENDDVIQAYGVKIIQEGDSNTPLLTHDIKAEADPSLFRIIDAKTDRAYIGDGQLAYKLYAAPRLLYRDESGLLQEREPGWNWFHETQSTQLASLDVGGYHYTVPLGKDTIKVQAGDYELGGKHILPKPGNFSQHKEEYDTITTYLDMYPYVDIEFVDGGAWRERKIHIEKSPHSLTSGEQVIFWEEYVIPKDAIVLNKDGKQLFGTQTIEGEHLFIQTKDGSVFTIGDAVVFDQNAGSTPEEREVSSEVYPVRQIVDIDYSAHKVKIGLVLDASYLLAPERVYPVTVDPGYYACDQDNLNQSGGAAGCSLGDITDLYLRYLAGGRGIINDLYLGYYNASGSPATRHSLMKFDLDIPQNVNISSGRIKMYQDRNGSGTYNGSINIGVYNVLNNWNSGDVEFRDLQGSLLQAATGSVSSGTSGWREWNITTLIEDWYSEDLTNNGILLQPTPLWDSGVTPNWPNRLIIFSSSRHGNRKGPYLYVNMEAVNNAEPNLVPVNASVDDTTLAPGESTTARVRVENIGGGDADSSYVGYYLSTNSTYSSNDIRLNTDTVIALNAGELSGEENDPITIPADWNNSGRNYILFRSDYRDDVDESDESDNVVAVPITISEDLGDPNEPDDSCNSATNIGGSANYSNNQLTLSEDDEDWFTFSYDGASYCFKVRGYNGNSTGPYNLSFARDGASLTIETSERSGETDTYLELYEADGVTRLDYDDDDGEGYFSLIDYTLPVVSQPDLVPNNPQMVQDAGALGGPIDVSVSVANSGNARSDFSRVGYYLSQNNTYGAGDVLLGSDGVSAQDPGNTSAEHEGLTIPSNWGSLGDNYILFYADYESEVAESNEDNNVVAIPITITVAPDIYESNNNYNTATNIGSQTLYTNNALSLTYADEDWFKFLYDNEYYYIKVRGFVEGETGNYNLSFQRSGRTVTIETQNRDGVTDTYLHLYDTDHATELEMDDDSGENGRFSRIVFDMPFIGYCNGGCGGGGGGGPPPQTNELPDQDADTFADVEEAFVGTAVASANQSAPIYDIHNHNYNTKLADKSAGNYAADPVNTRTGAFEFIQTDFTLKGRGIPINFVRNYNSKTTDKNSHIGNGWNYSHNVFYYQDPGSKNVQVYLGGALTTIFTTQDNGQTFSPPKGEYDELFWDGEFLVYKTLDGTRYEFSNRLTSQLGILDQIVDTNNNTTQFNYIYRNDVPLLSQIMDASGRLVNILYGDEGGGNWNNIVTIQEVVNNEHPRIVQYGYDNGGNLLSVTTNRYFEGVEEQIVKTFTYDAAGMMATYTDPRGTVLYNEYDVDGRVVVQREHNPRIDAQGSSRLVWELSYGGGIAAAPGSVACTTVTSHKNAQSSYQDITCFNADNHKTYHQDGEGNEAFWTHNDAGMQASYTDANGFVTQYQYDDRRRLVREIVPETNWYTQRDYEYEDVFNTPIRVTTYYRLANDVNAARTTKQTTHTIDNSTGNIISTTDSLGNQLFYQYDAFGNRSQLMDKNGQITLYGYDALGNYVIQESATVEQVDGSSQNIATQYVYDVYGNVSTMTDPVGNVFSYVYDTKNNIRKETDPLGGITVYTYDAEDHMVTQTDPLGRVIQHTYDTDIEASLLSTEHVGQVGEESIIFAKEYDYLGNLVREVDPRGNEIIYVYDNAGRVTERQMPHNTITYAYDNNGNVLEESNSLGQLTQFTYNARNELTQTTKSTAAGDATTVVTYDGFGRKTSIQNPNGGETLLTYDEEDRMLSSTDPLGNSTMSTYDANGNRVSVTTPRGNQSLYAYDGKGRVIQETDAFGSVTHMFYDPNGNEIRRIDRQDANGGNANHITQFAYDELNRLAQTTDATGSVVHFTYDAVGNQTQVTDPLNRVTTYTYDTFNRRISQIDPAGNITSYTYDKNNNLLETRFPDASTMVSVYDASNRKTQFTNGEGNTTTFVYDAAGNVLTKTDARGNEIHFAYDGSNRLTQETNAQGTATAYTYDVFGNRTQTAVDGQTTGFVYDNAHRIVQVIHPGNKLEEYIYDADGNVITYTDGTGSSIHYTYDALGRKTEKQIEGEQDATHYAYNNWGQVFQVTEPELTRNYAYDEVGNLVLAQHTFADSPQNTKDIVRTYNAAHEIQTLTDAAGRALHYTYDNRGLLDQVEYAGNTIADYTYNSFGKPTSLVYANGVQTSYNYDNTQRMTDMHVQGAGDNTLLQQQYVYDATNNRTAMTETFVNENNQQQSRTIQYDYDTLDQLTTVSYNDRDVDNSLTFDYDAKGNRTLATGPFGSMSYAYNGAGELTNLSQNSRLAIASAYNQNGSLSQEQYTRLGRNVKTVDYSWDKENRLQEIRYTNTARPAYLPALEQNIIHFTYNNEGNRIKKRVNNEAVYYINTGLSVLNELDDNLAVTKTLVQGVGNIAEINEQGEITYLHTDALGSTMLITNQNGELATEYDYDVFGALLGMKGSLGTRYLFTGQEFDAESSLYYYNARYYNPRLGRFISRDAYLGEDGDSLTRNRYIYVSNNPLKFVDPSGEFLDTIWDVGNLMYDTGKAVVGVTKTTYGIGKGFFTDDWSTAKSGVDIIKESVIDFGADAVAAAIPFVPAGTTKAVRSGKKIKDSLSGVKKIVEVGQTTKQVKRWKVGDAVDTQTRSGSPAWSTVRSRYWKNEAAKNPGGWTGKNLDRMKSGKAPKDGRGASYEIDHIAGRNVNKANSQENLRHMRRKDHIVRHQIDGKKNLDRFDKRNNVGLHNDPFVAVPFFGVGNQGLGVENSYMDNK